MCIYKTAYDTFVFRGFVKSKFVHAIEQAVIQGAIQPLDPCSAVIPPNEKVFAAVRIENPQVAAIPGQLHPITFTHPQTREECVFIDQRGPTRPADNQNVGAKPFKVYSEFEYNVNSMRALLQAKWGEHSAERFLSCSRLPITVYSKLVAESLGRKLGLDYEQQFKFMVLAAYFYVGLHYNREQFAPQDTPRIAVLISKACGFKINDILEVIEHLPLIKDIEAFCAAAQTVINDTRVQQLTTYVLISAMGNSWFATNSSELMCVALEHPPTWMAILYAAYSERAYKNTAISNLVKNEKPDVVKSYMYSVLSLCAH